MGKKRKVINSKIISAVTALTMLSSITPAVNAATSRHYTTRYDSNGEYYRDENGFRVYDNFIIDRNGNRIYEGYYFDNYDNVVLDYYQDYSNDYQDYNNNGNHINVDISDPEILNRYLQAHSQNCHDYDCQNGNYINHGNANNGYSYPYPNNITSNNVNGYNQLYTVVKTVNGVTKYAYSPVANVEQYGIYGWSVNSTYNQNDLDLNSVFFEEINTFGNDYRWNVDIVNKINSAHNLFIWTYTGNDGNMKYCVSPIRYPENYEFTYNSDFNINDVDVALKTFHTALQEKVYSRGLTN